MVWPQQSLFYSIWVSFLTPAQWCWCGFRLCPPKPTVSFLLIYSLLPLVTSSSSCWIWQCWHEAQAWSPSMKPNSAQLSWWAWTDVDVLHTLLYVQHLIWMSAPERVRHCIWPTGWPGRGLTWDTAMQRQGRGETRYALLRSALENRRRPPFLALITKSARVLLESQDLVAQPLQNSYLKFCICFLNTVNTHMTPWTGHWGKLQSIVKLTGLLRSTFRRLIRWNVAWKFERVVGIQHKLDCYWQNLVSIFF